MEQLNPELDAIAGLLKTYTPSKDTIELVRQTPITLLAGISGAGKDTIQHSLMETGKFHRITTHTTRKPRQNGGVWEQDGVEYHFISMPKAREMFEHGEFIEGNIYSGNVYGTSVAEIQQAHDKGLIAVTDIDVNGVAHYKHLSPDVIAVFVIPPSFEQWQQRLLARYGESNVSPEDLYKRMHTAITELEQALARPYYHFVVNDELARAVHAVESIAHGHDTFNEVDEAVHAQAAQLLADLRTHLG